MKKMKNKKIILIVILACFALLLVLGVRLLKDYATDTEAIYGNRLDGIDEVKITSSKKTEIIKNVESNNNTKNVSVHVQGKIINILITLNDDTSRDDGKALSGKVVEKLSDKEKEFYDVQVFIKKTNDDQVFPIIGYLKHSNKDFTWTLDR